jgi:hypothetical protein
MLKEQSWPSLWCYPSICMEGLNKTKKKLIRNSDLPNADQKCYRFSPSAR